MGIADTPQGQVPEALRLAAEWRAKTQREADRQNSAYDHYGMGNTPETVDPLGAKMEAELRRLHAQVAALSAQPAATPSGAAAPLQVFESPRAKTLMRAWEEGWAACRDAEFVGEEAQNDAFNQSTTVNQCVAEDMLHQDHPGASHGQAPAGAAPEGWNGTYEHAWRMAAQYIGESEARSKKIWQDAGYRWVRTEATPAAQQAPAGATAAAWPQLRAALAITILGWGSRPDRTLETIGQVLDAVTEPGMPLAILRTAPDWREVWEVKTSPVAQQVEGGDAELWRTLMGLPGASRRIWNHVLDEDVKENANTVREALIAARAAQKEGEKP